MTQDSLKVSTVRNAACQFLLDLSVESLPVNPKRLIEKMGWGLVSYSELCAALKKDDEKHTVAELIEASGSKDGFTVKSHGNFCIAYNDTQKNNNRINFTLMHEAGHIVLGHFDIASEEEKEKLYNTFEKEADLFASEVLAPSAIIRACNINTPELLRAASGLSITAARKRLCDISFKEICPLDAELEKAFASYIEIVSRRNNFKAVFA